MRREATKKKHTHYRAKRNKANFKLIMEQYDRHVKLIKAENDKRKRIRKEPLPYPVKP